MFNIIYHANCKDGLASAAIAGANLGMERCNFLPTKYGDPLPELRPGPDGTITVFMLDFTFPYDVMMELANNPKILMRVIDHHNSVDDRLKEQEWFTFNNNHSAAILTYQYFKPNQPIPEIYRYIQDRDLWDWCLWRSKEVNAALYLWPNNDVQYFIDHANTPMDVLIKQGEVILQYEAKIITRAMQSVHEIKVGDRWYPAVNTPVLQSEIGNKIAEEYGGIGICYSASGLGWALSFRSIGDIDVSVIAKRCSGGGHKNAAGGFLPSLVKRTISNQQLIEYKRSKS